MTDIEIPQIFGMDLSTWDGKVPAPDQFQPVEAFVIVTGLNSDGQECYAMLTTAGLTRTLALGLMTETTRALLDWATLERYEAGREDQEGKEE